MSKCAGEKFRANSVGDKPNAIRRQTVIELKISKCFAVRDDALVGGGGGITISRHVIDILPDTIFSSGSSQRGLFSPPFPWRTCGVLRGRAWS